MKYAIILGVVLFSGALIAGEGMHKFSSGNNPHAEGGCASKKDKMAQFNKFHGQDWKQADAEKKIDTQDVKKEASAEDFI